MAEMRPSDGVVNGPDEAREAIRSRYKDGSDLIKITATGGVLSLGRSGDNAQFTDEELAAIVQTARDYRFTVAAHAHGREGMARAIRAGVNSIEHGSALDRDLAVQMVKKKTFLVPTLSAGATVTERSADPQFFPPAIRAKALEIGPKLARVIKLAREVGVKIAFGTDAGVGLHGQNAREFGLMVDAGIEPLAAIQSATIGAAELLQESENLGVVEKGKYADLIAVWGNPLENIRVLERVEFVMKGGVVVKGAKPH
jgi:imidazolonepropionase-like amidohydrolase